MCSFRLPQPGQKLQGRLSFPGLGLWHLAGLELVLLLYLPKHKPRGAISSKGKKGTGLEATLDWRVGLGRWGQLCHLQGLGTLVTDEVECGALCSEGDHDLMENPRVWDLFCRFSVGIFPRRGWKNLVPSKLACSACVLTVCLLWMLRLVRETQAMFLLSCLATKIIWIGYLGVGVFLVF